MHLLIPAFLAGLITFFAPCTLPLVPAYVALVNGLSYKKDGSVASGMRRTTWLNSVFFILGFSTVFVGLGTLAGLLGATLPLVRVWLARLGGILLALLGLSMLNLLKIPLLETPRHLFRPATASVSAPSFRAFSFGAAFAFGWSPCIGPILASILLFASQTSTVWTGTFLLVVFSLGLALPFLLITATIDYAGTRMNTLLLAPAHYRVLLLAVGGAMAGFLANVVVLIFIYFIEKGIGQPFGLTNFLMSTVLRMPYLLPFLGATLLGYLAHRNHDLPVVPTIGGSFLLFLGIILATGNFPVLTQYVYDVFRVFDYQRVLEYL